MRTHKALDLATELARSPDPQVRRNAATALAIIGSQEGIAELVGLAIEDKDREVRERAVEELALLSKAGAVPAPILAEIHRRMCEPPTREAAYTLLGNLRFRGLDAPLPPMSLWHRVRLAAAMRKGGGERFQYFRPLLMATLLAAAAMVLFALLVQPDLDIGTLVLLLAGSCLIPQLALLAVGPLWRWRPVALESDRLAAMLVDLRLSCLAGLAVGSLLLLLSGLETSFAKPSLLYAPVLGSIVLLASVRAGCGLSYGAFRRRSAGMAFQTAAGMAFGIVAVTAVAGVLRAWNSPIASTGWLLLLPISAGLASAISEVDHRVAPKAALFGRSSVLASSALIAVLVVCALLSGLPPRSTRSISASDTGTKIFVYRLTDTDFSPEVVPVPVLSHVHLRVVNPPPVGVWFSVTGPDAPTPEFPRYGLYRPGLGDARALLAISPAEIDAPWVGPLRAGAGRQRSQRVATSAVLPAAGQRLLDRVTSPRAWDRSAPALELAITPFSPKSAADQYQACWLGALRAARWPEIRNACEQALNLTPPSDSNYSNYLDTRGIYHAAIGEFHAAEEDFRPFYQDGRQLEINKLIRKQWLAERLTGDGRDSFPSFNRGIQSGKGSFQNALCWQGTVSGFASKPEIRQACRAALASASGFDGNIRDSVAVNRALNGELTPALIDDFTAFLRDPRVSPSAKTVRQRWVAELQKGNNPFTVDEVQRLRRASSYTY